MGTLKLSMTLLKREVRQSMFFFVTLVGAVAISFMFFNILDNPLLKTEQQVTGGAVFQEVSVPPTVFLTILVLTFVSIMVFFTSDFFMSKKASEFAILGMSGSHYLKTTRFLMYQLFVLLVAGIVIGLGIGIGATFLANAIIYQYMGINATPFTLLPSAFGSMLAVFGTLVLILVILAMGYVFRNDILALLSQGRESIKQDKRALKIPSFLFVLLYGYGFVAGVMTDNVGDFSGVALMGCLGAIGVIRYFIPDMVKRAKKGRLLTKKVPLIAYSNFVEIISHSVAIIAMTVFSVILVSSLMFGQADNNREFIISMIGLFVIIALLFTSIMFKVLVEVETRKRFFDNVYHVGYTKTQIIKMIDVELVSYYGVILIMPTIYLVLMAWANITKASLDPIMAVITIGYFILVGLVSLIACRHIYVSRVKTFIGRER